jgi:hypothetical protein
MFCKEKFEVLELSEACALGINNHRRDFGLGPLLHDKFFEDCIGRLDIEKLLGFKSEPENYFSRSQRKGGDSHELELVKTALGSDFVGPNDFEIIHQARASYSDFGRPKSQETIFSEMMGSILDQLGIKNPNWNSVAVQLVKEERKVSCFVFLLKNLLALENFASHWTEFKVTGKIFGDNHVLSLVDVQNLSNKFEQTLDAENIHTSSFDGKFTLKIPKNKLPGSTSSPGQASQQGLKVTFYLMANKPNSYMTNYPKKAREILYPCAPKATNGTGTPDFSHFENKENFDGHLNLNKNTYENQGLMSTPKQNKTPNKWLANGAKLPNQNPFVFGLGVNGGADQRVGFKCDRENEFQTNQGNFDQNSYGNLNPFDSMAIFDEPDKGLDFHPRGNFQNEPWPQSAPPNFTPNADGTKPSNFDKRQINPAFLTNAIFNKNHNLVQNQIPALPTKPQNSPFHHPPLPTPKKPLPHPQPLLSSLSQTLTQIPHTPNSLFTYSPSYFQFTHTSTLHPTLSHTLNPTLNPQEYLTSKQIYQNLYENLTPKQNLANY